MLAYSARRLELIALFENREYPSTDRRILGAFCAAAMGAQNAWTTRSSLKTSTVIVGTNLQKIAEILYLRVRRKLEGCCSSSVPELGRWEIWGDMGRYGRLLERRPRAGQAVPVDQQLSPREAGHGGEEGAPAAQPALHRQRGVPPHSPPAAQGGRRATPLPPPHP